jgi:hypothetical protein
MTHHDITTDRLYNCLLVYHTPAGKRIHYRTKTIARAADLALDIAQRHITHDTRRKVRAIEFMEAIEA